MAQRVAEAENPEEQYGVTEQNLYLFLQPEQAADASS